MDLHLGILDWILLVPTIGGAVYSLICLASVLLFFGRPAVPKPTRAVPLPPVTVLKPVHGLEKNLREHLLSICRQDYPDYQVVFSAQDPNDPAIPLLLIRA